MISEPRIPMPDRVAALAGASIPQHVLVAEAAAVRAAAYLVNSCPLPRTREEVLSGLARANKILAAFDPSLTVRPGGAS
ncbi:hypothetical protein [Streptomyces sp. NPDC001404]|uniref:hypothetical protein n=1 Tax=Streptomyces sp. NPDC001404 TaxID=3364571 RepID=UPI0036D0C8EE